MKTYKQLKESLTVAAIATYFIKRLIRAYGPDKAERIKETAEYYQSKGMNVEDAFTKAEEDFKQGNSHYRLK